VDFAAASQMTAVELSQYRFHASTRTEGLTTAHGIRFRMTDGEPPAHLGMIFGQFTGVMPCSVVEYNFAVPLGTGLLQDQVIRQQLLRFDNKIGAAA
jgi:hypothetical protein